MSNYVLTIFEHGEEDEQIVRIHIGNIDPKTAAMTVLKALSDVPQPITKKTRSDKGKRRKPATAETPPQTP